MKKLYLHMGFHKTATSSFQETCKKNIDKLASQGFCYPLFNSAHIRKKDILNHGIPLSSLYSENPEKSHININHYVQNVEALHYDYRKSLEDYLSSDNNIIISGEDISVLSEKGLYQFKQFLEQYSFEIIPVVVVRSPYEFMCSMVQQRVKSGIHLTSFFDERYSSVVKVRSVFPNTQFFSFKEICKHAYGPVGFLLEHIGVDYKDFTFVRTNESISNTITRIQNDLNKKEAHIVDDKINPRFIAIRSLDSKDFKQKFLLTKEEYHAIEEQCTMENENLRTLLGDEFTDKNIKFAQDSSMDQLYVEFFRSLEKRFAIKISDNPQGLATLYSYKVPQYIHLLHNYYRILTVFTIGKTRKYFEHKKRELKCFISLVALLSHKS